MKKIIYSMMVLILSSSFGGCKKMLDTNPYSFTTVDNFYKTAQDAELALVGCYSVLNAASIQGVGGGRTFNTDMPIMLCSGTDELVSRDGYADVNMAPFGLNSVTSQNEIIRYNWFFLFAGINRTNYLLDNIGKTDMPAARKQQIIGEAHFLRGLYYMYLAMMYGGVPVYTTSDQDPTAVRQPLKDVYDLIIADFQLGYQTLPARSTIPGRANKWSAAGFLAKVYTYLASCKQNQVGKDLNFALNSFDWVDAADMYQKAKTITTDIIANSAYKLTTRYDNLFRETTKSWQYEECLFDIEGSTNSISGNYNIWYYFQIPVGNVNTLGGGSSSYRPLGEMWNKYNALDKRRGQNLTLAMAVTSPVEVIDGVNYYVPLQVTTPKTTNYCVGKFRYKDPAAKKITLSYSEGNNPLLRFADILLLHAEILFNTGDEAGARNMLLQVRQRIVANAADVNTLTTAYRKTDFMQELLDERSRELCFEGWRRIDLIRFGKFVSAIAGLSKDAGYWNTIVPTLQTNTQSYRIWFPIPQTERDLSPLDQNPGY